MPTILAIPVILAYTGHRLDIILIDGILPKGPYPPCLRMADRALLAGFWIPSLCGTTLIVCLACSFLINNDQRLLTLPVTWRSRDPARSAPCSAPLHWPDRALATLTTRGRSSGTSGPSRARDRKHLAGSRAARALASCPWSRPLESRWREPVEPERE